jgi:hypothetical protein
MIYAVQNDGLGWRTIGEAKDLLPGETLSETKPVLTIAPQPDPAAFVAAVKVAVGGIIGANTLMCVYPALMPAIDAQDWSDLQLLIEDAKTTGTITAAQYDAFKAAATANHIPVAL